MTNYYIEKDNKIELFDTDRIKVLNTIAFMPQYAGFEIKETEKEIIAHKGGFVFLEDVETELLQEAKERKYKEANEGARKYLETEALYELESGNHIEATDGNIAKLSAYALSFLTGILGENDVVYWNTKEDETIALTKEQLTQVLQGIGEVQAEVWNVKFPAYLAQIEAAVGVDEVEGIKVDYSIQLPAGESEVNSES